MHFEMSTNHLRKLLSDLNRLQRNSSAELNFLMRHWPQIERVLDVERSRLLNLILGDDPIRADCDLLGPLGSNTDEVRHTQALSFLFDPSRPHGFGSTILRRFLLSLVRVTSTVDQDIRDMVRLIQGATDIVVIPERRHLLNSSSSRKVPRTDLWIEIHNPKTKGLLVIENKVGSRELVRQLKDFELPAKKWCSRYAKSKRLFVFLTVDGDEPKSAGSEQWIPASYPRLARTLRDVLKENQKALAISWLRLYVASIGRNVLGLRLGSPGTINIARLQDYAGVAR
jgi:hypothetical protein